MTMDDLPEVRSGHPPAAYAVFVGIVCLALAVALMSMREGSRTMRATTHEERPTAGAGR